MDADKNEPSKPEKDNPSSSSSLAAGLTEPQAASEAAKTEPEKTEEKKKPKKYKKKKKETKKETAKTEAEAPAAPKEEEKKELPPDPKVLEWKAKIPELERECEEVLTEAVGYFNLPPMFTMASTELDPLKAKFGPKLQDPGTSEAELAFSLTKLLAPLIEGSLATQTELFKECSEYLESIIPQNSAIIEKTGKLLPTIAQRKCLGIKKPEENAKESLYCWEIENFTMIEVQNIKDVRTRREQRRMLGQKLQKMWKLITTIKDAKTVDDIKKITDAEENYMKIKRKEIAQKQKELDKKAKEDEKKFKEEQRRILEEQKAEEKKRLKEEQQKLKEEQRRIKEELKAEEKKAKKRKHDELVAKNSEEIQEPVNKKSKDEEQVEEPKKDTNQRTLTAFFPAKKIEAKTEKPAKKPKIYTDVEPIIPRLSFSKSINLEEFDNEISGTNPSITRLQLNGQCIQAKKTSRRRKKYIFVGDSDINRGGKQKDLYTFRSKTVTPRNPFALDPCINYDLDTDEEYEELHGEEIKSDENEDKDAEEMSAGSDDWLVSDNYLSADEKLGSGFESEEERAIGFKPNVELFSIRERDPEIIVYQTCSEEARKILIAYKAEPLLATEFPIAVGKETEEEKKKEKVVHPKIEGEALTDFIKIIHGSYWPVWKIRDAFQKSHPEISARLIKKKVPSVAMKEKGPQDFKKRYYVKKELFPENITEEEMAKLFVKNGEETAKDLAAEKTPQKEDGKFNMEVFVKLPPGTKPDLNKPLLPAKPETPIEKKVEEIKKEPEPMKVDSTDIQEKVEQLLKDVSPKHKLKKSKPKKLKDGVDKPKRKLKPPKVSEEAKPEKNSLTTEPKEEKQKKAIITLQPKKVKKTEEAISADSAPTPVSPEEKKIVDEPVTKKKSEETPHKEKRKYTKRKETPTQTHAETKATQKKLTDFLKGPAQEKPKPQQPFIQLDNKTS